MVDNEFNEELLKLAIKAGGEVETLADDWFVGELRLSRKESAKRFLEVALTSPYADVECSLSGHTLTECLPTAYHALIRQRHVDEADLRAGLQMLIDGGVDFTVHDGDCQDTPVTCAARCGNIAALQFLLETLPEAALRLPTFNTAETFLHAAAAAKDTDTLKLAYDAAERLGMAHNLSRLGDSPLHLAIEAHDTDGASFLIGKGYDVNALPTNKIAMTPIMMAVDEDDHDMVELLLEAGANPSQKAHDGRCVFDLPSYTDFEDLFRQKRDADRAARADSAAGATRIRARKAPGPVL